MSHILSRVLALLFLALTLLTPQAGRGQDESPTQTGGAYRILAGDYERKIAALVEPDNSVAWSAPIRAIHDAQLLDNGNILFQTSFTNVIETDRSGRVVWRYDVEDRTEGGASPVEIHSFQRLPGGLTMVAESGSRRIIELDADGKVVHEIPLTVDNPHPHRDTRLVRTTEQHTFVVAHEGDQVVREYDHDGRVIWQYDVGSQLYSAVRLDNGNTLIGTGDGHSVIEVTPDGKTVWSLTSDDLPGIELHWVTMVERLPNGNTVVTNCHAGPQNPQMLEVTAEKRVVWTFKDFDRFGNSMPVGVRLPVKQTSTGD